DVLETAGGWMFAGGGKPQTVPVRSRLIVNTADAAIDAAVTGLGITRVLSYQIYSELKAGRLALALKAFEPARWPVNLVHAGQGPLPQKTRAFLDFTAPRLKARL